MNNGLDINKYLHSINANAAIKAVKNVAYKAEDSVPKSNADMQFNNYSNGTQHTKSWIS